MSQVGPVFSIRHVVVWTCPECLKYSSKLPFPKNSFKFRGRAEFCKAKTDHFESTLPPLNNNYYLKTPEKHQKFFENNSNFRILFDVKNKRTFDAS